MITDWLIRRFAGSVDPHADPILRMRYGLLEGWAGVAVNAVLFLTKGAMALASGSIALMADAVHTLADMTTSIVVIVGFRMARKPFDEEHPFGHGRSETIATLVIAVLLIVAGVEFLRSSIGRLLQPLELSVSWVMLVILAATVVVKEWLARFSRSLGRRIGSATLEADFWHHRTDSIATGLVIAGFLLSQRGLGWVDGVAGIGVSLIIAWTGIDIGRRAVSHLLGQAPTRDEVHEIRRSAMDVDGVRGIHDIVVHHYGENRAISLHIEVSSDEDPMRLHEISDIVEKRLARTRGDYVVVHIDPINTDHPNYRGIQELLARAVRSDPRCESFHDLRIIGTPERFVAVFDLAVHTHLEPRMERALRGNLEALLREQFPGIVGVVIQVEPAFVRRY